MSEVVSLKKGEVVNLSKHAPGLTRVMVGLGWDPAKTVMKKGLFGTVHKAAAPDIDCDASAILLKNGRFVDNHDLVYFSSKKHPSGAVVHMGDNLTGDGDGDDEQILIQLDHIPGDYDTIVLTVTIYSAHSRGQNFGMIENTFIRLVDEKTGREVCKYTDAKIATDNSDCTTLIFGELKRTNGAWEFKAIGEGNKDGSIGDTCKRYR